MSTLPFATICQNGGTTVIKPVVTHMMMRANTTALRLMALPTDKWDDTMQLLPEHFADMTYQVCALSRGGCVSEMNLYGLAQDIVGF